MTQRLVAIVAVAIVPVAAALVYFIVAYHQERERDVRDMALRTSQIVALEMERIVTGADAVLKALAVAPAVRNATGGCDAYLGEILTRLPQFSGFAVLDASGEARCAAGTALGQDTPAERSWFRAAVAAGSLVVGEYTGGRPDAAAYLPVALAVEDDGERRVLVTNIDLAWLGVRLRERNLAQGSVLAIADRNGTLIAREPQPGEFVGQRISGPNLSLVRAVRPGTIEITGQDGTRRILGYYPPAATGIGLYVSAGFSTEVAFAQLNASTWRSLALAAAGAVGACLVAWSIGDRLFRQPIRRLLATIASWQAGDEAARSRIRPDGSELSALAAAIDEYMDNLAVVRAERAAAEQHRTLVLREMNHRIKNILAAVQAIANQTFKGRATTDSLRAFGNRLSAMAGAHDLLVTKNWESADFHQSLKAALDPFGFDRQRQFTLDGPPLRITAKAALSLAMALHELCTNAAKYGALTTPSGHVAIRWWLAPGEAGERFHLTWIESGGPPVAEPRRTGFGTRLIQAALASELSATADLDFAEDGVRFTLDADAALVVAEDPGERAAETAA